MNDTFQPQKKRMMVGECLTWRILFVVPEEPVDTLDMTLQQLDPDFEDITTY